jgi:hypothetical protein
MENRKTSSKINLLSRGNELKGLGRIDPNVNQDLSGGIKFFEFRPCFLVLVCH